MKIRFCTACKIELNLENANNSVLKRGGKCRSCCREYMRQRYNYLPDTRQIPGEVYIFPCGCTGILPSEPQQANLFVCRDPLGWKCRVSVILNASQQSARKRKYKPIDLNTPHSVIRKMMNESDCERCGEPLKWELGFNKTPHLHHDHVTGKIYGFVHFRCNPRALEVEIDKLRRLLEISIAERDATCNKTATYMGQ